MFGRDSGAQSRPAAQNLKAIDGVDLATKAILDQTGNGLPESGDSSVQPSISRRSGASIFDRIHQR